MVRSKMNGRNGWHPATLHNLVQKMPMLSRRDTKGSKIHKCPVMLSGRWFCCVVPRWRFVSFDKSSGIVRVPSSSHLLAYLIASFSLSLRKEVLPMSALLVSLLTDFYWDLLLYIYIIPIQSILAIFSPRYFEHLAISNGWSNPLIFNRALHMKNPFNWTRSSRIFAVSKEIFFPCEKVLVTSNSRAKKLPLVCYLKQWWPFFSKLK